MTFVEECEHAVLGWARGDLDARRGVEAILQALRAAGCARCALVTAGRQLVVLDAEGGDETPFLELAALAGDQRRLIECAGGLVGLACDWIAVEPLVHTNGRYAGSIVASGRSDRRDDALANLPRAAGWCRSIGSELLQRAQLSPLLHGFNNALASVLAMTDHVANLESSVALPERAEVDEALRRLNEAAATLRKAGADVSEVLYHPRRGRRGPRPS